MLKTDSPARHIKPQASLDAMAQLVVHLFKVNGALLSWGDQFTESFGLTSAKWQMLGAIALAQAPLSAPQLAIAMGVTRQGVQKQLNLLKAEGLIEALPNPHHQRSPQFKLSRKGQSLYLRLDKQWQKVSQRWTSQLNSSDLKATTRLLDNLMQLMSTSN